jgi:hypothetical protein
MLSISSMAATNPISQLGAKSNNEKVSGVLYFVEKIP